MFTQCSNCQAIFRVSMREITVSQGFLRCGECLEIFDSSKNLSTTMQEPFVDVDINKKAQVKHIPEEHIQTISALDDWQSVPSSSPSEDNIKLKNNSKSRTQTRNTKTVIDRKGFKNTEFKRQDTEKKASSKQLKTSFIDLWPKITIGLLSLLLVFQLTYHFINLLLDSKQYDHEKIQMLNHNVFAHPIDKDVLLISASIENTAEFDQPFPILEVRLTNSEEKLVALRRFTPEEYLDSYSPNNLLIKNRATSIKLKIQDPGNEATRFQFDFL